MPPALMCLSHLRWDFVYQRPNHLMARAARDRRVYFVEEAAGSDGGPWLETHDVDGLTVVRPHVPDDLDGRARENALAALVQDLIRREGIAAPWLWYYTPMALGWTGGIDASAVIYDCMDELSAFRGAPPELVKREGELFRKADVVFTGGRSLYEAKASHHPRVHAMPSAVEVQHFARARQDGPDPSDQASIARPRIGYYGVIDERIDRELISEVARLRPDWQLVLVGPVAKLAPDEVPSAPNIHRLGMKSYDDLPDYLRGWDVAIMPFALNEATRYISPTKTPEYLAGGKPVVSTAVRDVVHPYADLELVRIAGTADEFVAAIEAALEDDVDELCSRADGVLAEMSWDATWARMHGIVRAALDERAVPERVVVPRRSQLPVGVAASTGFAVTTVEGSRAAARATEPAGRDRAPARLAPRTR